MQMIWTFLRGMAMGTADIIPGVSGGTMALILGIYPRLIRAISAWGAVPKRLLGVRTIGWNGLIRPLDLVFVVALGAGLVAAVVVMTKVVGLPHLLRAHPSPVYGLFFGLITSSIWFLMKEEVGCKRRAMVPLLVGLALGLLVALLKPAQTPDSQLFYFLCGVLAISAMLLPGISGSFILLLLGKYADILDALASVNLTVILPFIAGCGVGLIGFAQVIRWMLDRYRAGVMAGMVGLLTGTLLAVWPFQERVYQMVRGKERLVSASPVWPESVMQGEALLSIGCMVLGFGLIMLLHRLAKRSG